MIQSVIMILIACVIAALLYGVAALAKMNPELINGFKWGETPEEKEEDRRWLGLFHSCWKLTAAVLLFGCIVASLLKSEVLYVFFIILPVLAASIYCLVKSPKRMMPKSRNAIVALLSAVMIAVVVLIGYVRFTDLDATVEKDRIEVAGMYDVTVKCSEITDMAICNSLPKISFRTNGVSLDGVKLGHFQTADGEEVLLLLHGDAPFIRIMDKEHGTIYMNAREAGKTQALYKQLKPHCN